MNVNLINYLDAGGLLIGIAVTMTALAIGHWYPWIRMTLIRQYVYGVSSIIAGFTTWRLMFGVFAALTGLANWTLVAHELLIPAGLLLISVSGGATVVWAYRRDEIALKLRQAERGEELLPNALTK